MGLSVADLKAISAADAEALLELDRDRKEALARKVQTKLKGAMPVVDLLRLLG